MWLTKDEQELLDCADRLIAQGVKGDRNVIAAMIFEVAVVECEACATIADTIRARLEGEGDLKAGHLVAADIARAIRSRHD